MYGWQNYPVTVIYRSTENLNKWRILNERVEIDLILTQNSEARDKLLQAMGRDLVSDSFALLNQEPKNGYYIFVQR